jgi:excisionase family DNA binding protein
MTAQTLQLTLPDGLLHSIAQRVAELLQQPAGGTGGAPVEPWLGVSEAAGYLACPVSRIYDLVALGRLHPHRDGRRLLFRTADLDAALAQ